MSKTKVSILNTAYKVNPRKKTIVCILKCVYTMDIHHCDDIFISDYDVCKKFSNTRRTSRGLEFTAVGVAKCHKDDVFNEELGQKIALARAEIAMLNIASAITWYLIFKLDDVNREFSYYNDNITNTLVSEKEYLDTLINK